MGIPGALVCHDRHVDRARNLGEALDALDRLLEIGEIAPLHAAERADRFAGSGVALIGVDAKRDARPDRLAHAAHHLHVTIRIDADLDLDGQNAFARPLARPRARPPRSRSGRANG